MTTKREEIMTAILSDLNTNRPSGVPEFKNRRLLPESPVASATCSVYWNIERVQAKGNRTFPIVNRSAEFVVEYRDVTIDETELDSMMEPLIKWGTKALVKEKPLGGKAIEIVEQSTTWTPFFLEKYYPIVRQIFVVTFQTSKYDQERGD